MLQTNRQQPCLSDGVIMMQAVVTLIYLETSINHQRLLISDPIIYITWCKGVYLVVKEIHHGC